MNIDAPLADTLPDTMQAFRLIEPQKAELMELPVPKPAPGQVLLKVAGVGLCHSDLHIMHGTATMACPITLGHETAGWVAALGDGVQGVAVGEPVVVHGAWGCGYCVNCRQDMENLCQNAFSGSMSGGLGVDGGMAEYFLVPSARHLVPLGDLDPRLAGPLDDAVLTPYHVIRRWRHLLLPGTSVVVLGVGGLGHMAVQLLKVMSPARVVAVDISQSKLDLATSLGADETVLNTQPDSSPESLVAMAEEIKQHFCADGAELVMDMVGIDSSLALAAKLVAPMGHLCCVGAAMGTLPWNFITTAYESTLSSTFWGTTGELREVVALAQAGKIKVLTETFPLAEAANAYQKLEAGEVQGRAIVLP